MLQYFLSPEVNGVPTAELFDQLLITKEDIWLQNYEFSNKESARGRYNVMLTPKDARYSVGDVIEFKYEITIV